MYTCVCMRIFTTKDEKSNTSERKIMLFASRSRRRIGVALIYSLLVVMNVLFYVAVGSDDHLVDFFGIGSLLLVIAITLPLHGKTGFWRLTHARADALDERELQLTHTALSLSYGWFTVVCLLLVLAHAVMYRLFPGAGFFISVPLAGSLIYLAHTLPGAVLAWRERDVPAGGDS